MNKKLFASYSGNTWDKRSVRKAVQRHRRHVGLPPLRKGQQTHPKHWPAEERLRFVRIPVSPYDRSIEQAQLVMGLGLHCGLRREEMIEAEARDVDLYKRELHVVGKGDKERTVPLNGYMIPLLKPVVLSRLPEQRLLINENGSPLSGSRINDIVSTLAQRAGITYKNVTPHTLRHTFATRLKDKGVDIETIRRLLGHSRIEDTARYVHSGEEQMRDAVERLVQG